MRMTVFGAWHGKHELTVNLNTVEEAGIVVLKCPARREVTSLRKRESHGLCVLQGGPPEQTRPEDARTPSREE